MNTISALLVLISVVISSSAMDTNAPYIPAYVNCRTIFDVGYSEWCYMVHREQLSANKYFEATLNPIDIQQSAKALEEYQSELEELVRYRRVLLQKLLTTIQSVADWYGATSIILFYNRDYMWVSPNHDITKEVIDELNDYHEYINQLISIHEQPENKEEPNYLG